MMKMVVPTEYKCPFCKSTFDNPTVLQRHRMGSHKMDPSSSKHTGMAEYNR